MRNSLIHMTSVALLCALCSSCVVNHPSGYVSEPDYNKRAEVSNAHYKRKMTATGYTMLGVSAVAGGVAGWFTPMVSYYDGGQRVNLAPANAAIGAVIGFGTSYFISRMMGWGSSKQRPAKDARKWLKKSNPQYIVFEESSPQRFSIIHKSIEPNYTVKNMDDVDDFHKAFPSSTHSDNVVKQSVDAVKRDELLKVLGYYPSSSYALAVKKKYVTSSPDVRSMFAAVDKFPETKLDVESLSVPVVKDINDAVAFYQRFPVSGFSKKVVAKSFLTADQSKKDILMLKEMYEDDFLQGPKDPIAEESTTARRNYLDALYRLENPRDLLKVETFYDRYNWLNFPEKPTDIASSYWKVAYDAYDDGGYILYRMRNLATSSYYRDWNISTGMMEDFIKARLRDEVASKVKVKSTSTIGTTNDEWNNWCNNPKYTAGLVAEAGQIEYMVYGEVENTSKFDLPVDISVQGDLNREVTYQGTGFWTNLFAAYMNSALSSNSKIGSTTATFTIPVMRARSKSSYAAKLDFGDGRKKTGINFNDWIKYKSELYLSGATATPRYNEYRPNQETLRKQESWLYMAKNGMPNVELTDLWRGEAVKQSVWEQRYVEDQERRRIERERAIERNKQFIASGSCVEQINSTNLTETVCGRKISLYEVVCRTEYGDTRGIHIYFKPDCSGGKGAWTEHGYVLDGISSNETEMNLAAQYLCGCRPYR